MAAVEPGRGRWAHLALLLVLWSFAGMVSWCAHRRPVPPSAEFEETEISSGLVQPVEKLVLEDAPLRNAIGALSQKTGVRIRADWDSLAVVDGPPRAAISTRLFRVKLATALDVILRQFNDANGLKGDASLAYDSDGATVTIRRCAGLPRVTRIYDIRALLDQRDAYHCRIKPAGRYTIEHAMIHTGCLYREAPGPIVE